MKLKNHKDTLTDKYASHTLHIDSLVAVENEDLSAEHVAESFNRLSFTSSSWTVWVPSHTQVHTCRKMTGLLLYGGQYCVLDQDFL